jgi:hypothetical protein
MKKILFVMSSVLMSSCSVDIVTSSDFDRACQAFEALSKYSDLDAMSAGDRDLFIFNQIQDVDVNSNAKTGWVIARSAVVEERYELYKSLVDSIEGGNWSCLAMNELAPSIEAVYINEGS